MRSASGESGLAAGREAVRTFLIADIRGYTVFTRDHGDAVAARLATKFAEIAREGVEANGGEVVELRGDEALAVFVSARAAIRAAGDLQAVFAQESSEDTSLPLPVGIGLDAGEAVRVEEGYRGDALNLAARLCSKAGAGEVLASTGVMHIARTVEGLRVEPMAPIELKGYVEPVVPIRLVFDTPGPAQPPRPTGVRAALPRELNPVSPLVGRDRDLRWLRWRWRGARHGRGRVVSVTGPEGIGKTRLISELAREVYAEGWPVGYARCAGPAGEALHALRARSEGPRLVLADDVDLAPGSVLDAFDALADSTREQPLLLVATHRGDEAPLVRTLFERGRLTKEEARPLDVLDDEAVRAIASLYVGMSGPRPPIEMLEQIAGIPGTAHRLIGFWARKAAASRLGASVDRTAGGRHTFQRAQQELATNIIDLQTVRERASLLASLETEGSGAVVCPYKGLATFQSADAEYFFGRERLVAELVARLVGSAFLGVVGPSGSGKSSAVRAGLMPALSSGVVPGSEGWIQAVMRPGEHPLEELERALVGVTQGEPAGVESALQRAAGALPREGRIVLLVDQFEEVFTACRDEEERWAFLDVVAPPEDRSPRNVVVVLAVRADFYGRCAMHPRLAHLLGDNHVLVGPMGSEELRRAVELPALRAGLQVEPDLVDALVADVLDQPGGLPLLSSALLELWQRRSGRSLTAQTYRETGGVQGAVARLAEAAFQRLDADEQVVARSIFLRLTGSGEGDEIVRRRVPLEELDLDNEGSSARVVAALTDARLLTVSEGTAEVAHEALLREWPRLRGWLEEDVRGRELHRRLTIAAAEWAVGGRDSGELYRGARLGAVIDWTAERSPDLNQLERHFLEESRALSEREAERARRANRRLRVLLSVVALFLVLAVVAGGLFLVQRGRAEHQAVVAEAQRLGALAVTQDHLDLALLLAREAVNLDDSVETRGALLTSLLRAPQATGVFDVGAQIQTMAAGGETLAVADADGVTLFDWRTRARTGRIPVPDVGLMALSPDGGALALSSSSAPDADVQLWDVQAVKKLHAIAAPGDRVSSLTFAPDGRTLGGIIDHSAVFWDTETGTQLGRPLTLAGGPVIWSMEKTPDGRGVVTSSDRSPAQTAEEVTILWDLDTRSPARTFPVGGDMTLSPDGRTVALGNDDGSIRLLDPRTGHVRVLGDQGVATIPALAFSPDGQELAAPDDVGSVTLWNVASGTVEQTLPGSPGLATALAYAQNGETLFASGVASSVVAWDTTGERSLGRLLSIPPREDGSGVGFAYSPDGSVFAVTTPTSIQLIDAAKLRVLRRIEGSFYGLAFNRDGSRLAASAYNDSVLIDPTSGSVVKRIPGVNVLGFDASGSTMWATRVAETRVVGDMYLSILSLVRLDGRTGAVLSQSRLGNYAWMTLSPDGSELAASAPGGRLDVWSLVESEPEKRYSLATTPYAASTFSPDGRLLAVQGGSDNVLLLDARTGRPLGRPLSGPLGLFPAGFDPSAVFLATVSSNGDVQLWDVAAHRQIASFPAPTAEDFGRPVFSPDGRHLAIVYASGQNYIWEIDPAVLKARACSVAGRNLTGAEWEQFLPERPYELVCPRTPR